MANDANVTALRELLTAHCCAEHGMACECIDSAAWLASQGVLVPSALTDLEIDHACAEDEDWKAWPSSVRAWLERIARGE